MDNERIARSGTSCTYSRYVVLPERAVMTQKRLFNGNLHVPAPFVIEADVTGS